LEALAVIPKRVSMTQERLMHPVKLEVKRLILDLGLSFEDVKELFSFFQHWKD